MKRELIRKLENQHADQVRKEEQWEERLCGSCNMPTKVWKKYTGPVTCDYCARSKREEEKKAKIELARKKQEEFNNRPDQLKRKYSTPPVIKLGDILSEK